MSDDSEHPNLGDQVEEKYRDILDQLIPEVNKLVENHGGLCSLGLIMADPQIQSLLKLIPEGYDRKLTKILRHYEDYFALLDNGMVATFLGYENGKVTESQDQKKESASPAADAGAGGLGARSQQSSSNPIGTTAPIPPISLAFNSLTSQNSHQDFYSSYARLDAAANSLWKACYNTHDEDAFIESLNGVHAIRREIWEKSSKYAVGLPPGKNGAWDSNWGRWEHWRAKKTPGSAGVTSAEALLSMSDGSEVQAAPPGLSDPKMEAVRKQLGQLRLGGLAKSPMSHSGSITVTDPEERSCLMEKLKQEVINQLQGVTGNALPLASLSQNPEISRLKKGVVAKFQKFLTDCAEFDVLDNRGLQTMVQLRR